MEVYHWYYLYVTHYIYIIYHRPFLAHALTVWFCTPETELHGQNAVPEGYVHTEKAEDGVWTGLCVSLALQVALLHQMDGCGPE